MSRSDIGQQMSRVMGILDSVTASEWVIFRKNGTQMVPGSGTEGNATDNKEALDFEDHRDQYHRSKIKGADAVAVPEDVAAENDAEIIQFGANYPEANGSDLQSYPVGSSGLPLNIGADVCRTEVQCSVFGSKSVGMVEMDSDGAEPTAEFSEKNSIHSGIHMEFPVDGFVESNGDHKRIESEQWLGPKFVKGVEKGRGNDMDGNNGDSVPVKSWKNLFSVPTKNNGMLQFSKPEKSDGKYVVKPPVEAVMEGGRVVWLANSWISDFRFRWCAH